MEYFKGVEGAARREWGYGISSAFGAWSRGLLSSFFKKQNKAAFHVCFPRASCSSSDSLAGYSSVLVIRSLALLLPESGSPHVVVCPMLPSVPLHRGVSPSPHAAGRRELGAGSPLVPGERMRRLGSTGDEFLSFWV